MKKTKDNLLQNIQNLTFVIKTKDELVQNLKEKFDDLFQRHESALNLIDELTEKIKILELNTRTEKNYPSENQQINLNYLMNSEKETIDDFIKKENQQENYTINMKVNFKNFKNKQKNLLRKSKMDSMINLIDKNQNVLIGKKDEILEISEEIYQKKFSKV